MRGWNRLTVLVNTGSSVGARTENERQNIMVVTKRSKKTILMFGASLLLLSVFSCVLETLPVKPTPTPVDTPVSTITPESVNTDIPYSHIPHPTSYTVGKWNLRAGPGTNYAVITVIPDGTLLTIEETRDDWLRVIYPGYAGWVHRKAIE